MKKIISMAVALVMILSLFSMSAYATDETISAHTPDDVIELVMGEITIVEDENGEVFMEAELLQEVEPEEGGMTPMLMVWKVVGVAQFKMSLHQSNGYGDFHWIVTLTNGDVIKAVSGTFVCERNNLLLPDFNYAKEYVSESYSVGTLYASARGSEMFSFSSTVPSTQNIRFKWANFYVTGVTGIYSVSNGNVTGTVADF